MPKVKLQGTLSILPLPDLSLRQFFNQILQSLGAVFFSEWKIVSRNLIRLCSKFSYAAMFGSCRLIRLYIAVVLASVAIKADEFKQDC